MKIELKTSSMEFPFGRCGKCGYEFNSELRFEYKITHCPKCGNEIDDFISGKGTGNDIYCENCGKRIWEAANGSGGGDWIDDIAGICSGGCERELCGSCGDWDVNGECEKCRNTP